MAIEDLTTYIEVDPGHALTVTSSKVTISAMRENESDYVYKDFGADNFDAIDLLLTIYIGSATTSGAFGMIGFSNQLGDSYVWSTSWFAIYILEEIYYAGIYSIGITCTGYGMDKYDVSANTPYYCRLQRSAGSNTGTLKIYSDSARTNLLDTLSVTGIGTTKFQYFYPIANNNNGGSADIYGYVENFDFQRKSAGQVRIIGEMM